MPYALRGTAVVRSDTGAVVKRHPTREKALAHFRALKANVEESVPVLDSLLGGAVVSERFALREDFHPGEKRGFHGRWIATFSHSVHGRTTSPIEAKSATEAWSKAEAQARASSGGRVHVTVQSVVPHDPRGPIKPEHVDPSRHPKSPQGLPADAAGLQRARATAAEHAAVRDALTHLPQGRFYSLHGGEGQVGHVQRTSQGWAVYGPKDRVPRVHKTPSSAAGHAMKIQRQAAVDTVARQQQRRRNLDRLGESVLGALLEARS